MEFLRVLEGMRTPALDQFMSVVTNIGDETVFMILAFTVFWCVSKRQGYYIFSVGLLGTTVNQWLKLIYRIPRPWVIDPNFTIVESARAGASGYSFPSGHTQNAVGTFGCLAMANRQVWLRAVCLVVILLIPFSRMYLGVHTPLDVGVAFAMAAVLTLALWPCFRAENTGAGMTVVFLVTAAVSIAFAVWVCVTEFPADMDAENLAHGIKNAWTLLGCALGLVASYWVDRKKLHFDEKAPFLGQLCKVVLGVAVLMAVRAALKPVLNALTGGAVWADGVRYFVMVMIACCVWPMTFPFFAKVGAKKETA